MPLSFEQTVALRYLRGASGRDERRGFLRFVIVAAIGGVAVGTGALLLAMMIVRGFSREIEAKIVGFGQHVQVESYLGDPLDGSTALVQRLEAVPGVVRAEPAVIDFSLLRGRRETGQPGVDGVLLWGTAEDAQPFVAENVPEGRFSFAPDARGRPGVVVGRRLAERLGLGVGDAVTAFSTRGLGQGEVRSRPRVKVFHVAGLFETGLGDFDDRFAYAALGPVRDLFGYGPDQTTRVDLTLQDRDRARATAQAVTDGFGPPTLARPIDDVYSGLFAWVALQQSIVPLVISILVVVAAFNIVGALLMVVIEKSREIGTVLAMGASRGAVRRLFVLLGLLVGSTGALIGAAVAVGLGALQARFHFLSLPADAYFLDSAPIEIRLVDVAWTVAAAVVLCTLAAYLPARAASRIEPIRSIRF
ncbi:MAG TPA: ABC transporter permease [Rubricoccaceae bacterium]